MPERGSRRSARERALGLLYEAEVKDRTPAQVIADLPVEADPYAADAVLGVGEQMAQIDERLRRLSHHWDLERMPALDRALLRLASWELSSRPDVPRNVVINEAVELAKTYSTEDSGRFVNGMLARIAEEVRPEPPAADHEPVTPSSPPR